MCSGEHQQSVEHFEEDYALVNPAQTESRIEHAGESSAMHRDNTAINRSGNEETAVSSTALRILKTTPSKRIRDVNGYRRRAAALCVRVRRAVVDEYSCRAIGRGVSLVVNTLADLEILLVSGRGEKDYWVLPGGGVEKEETTEEAVLREFREEAGIQGAVIAVIGEFTDDERYHRTTLFMLSIKEVFNEWEDSETGRQRRWMGAFEALQKIKKSQMTMVEQSLEVAADILNKRDISPVNDCP